ncbi:MAG: OmpH family outer membrane protein [Gammaproteobacteria bacterium]|nr:OmpH family outer membrane protein [Gammaproteobacteria bacterium]MDH3469265.1 OmpH family outer membrane protein [Gammaproteobacteria bacterium]
MRTPNKLGPVCGALALLFSVAVHAQNDLKIAYVNAVELVEEAPQGKTALKLLETEFGPRDQEIRAMRDESNALEDDLDKNGLVMAEAERINKEKQLRDLNRRIKRSRQEFREDYNLRRNEELSRLQQEISEAIVQIAKAEGYDLVLQDAVWASKRIDITEKILEKLIGSQ